MRVRHVATRLALMIAAAALVPVAASGTWLVLSLRQQARASAVTLNHDLATRTAERIRRLVAHDASALRAMGDELQMHLPAANGLEGLLETELRHQSAFRQLTLFDGAGVPIGATEPVPARLAAPAASDPQLNGVFVSVVDGSGGGPVCQLSMRLVTADDMPRWLVARASLDRMRQMLSDLSSEPAGAHAMLATSDSVSILGDGPLPSLDDGPQEYRDAEGIVQLATIERVPQLEWRILIERPLGQVFDHAAYVQRELAAAGVLSLVFMIVVGIVIGRRVVAPLLVLQRATEAIAGGDFTARVPVTRADEFGRLGNSFNMMADRLVALQNEIKTQERQVMFGRVVAGLFHDLNHPIQNIGNNAKLLLREGLDVDTRAAVRQTIDRELATLRRFMDDLLNVTRPSPLDRVDVDMNATVAEVIDAMRAQAERSGVTLVGQYQPGALVVGGDRFALGRVYRNLIANAIQATPAGGSVTITTARIGDVVEVHVTDTGSGIAPDRIGAIFDEFVTTRRQGLGLGLAVSRRIVEQHGGSISVTSHVGRGSTFTVRVPARAARVIQAAS